MSKKLKDITARFFTKGEEVDRILSLPITSMRMELKSAFQKKSFSESDYKSFISRLSDIEDIEEEIELVEYAVENREVQSASSINIGTPVKQLLWAAGLTRIMQTGDEPIVHSRIWQQLRDDNIYVRNEMIKNARVIDTSLQNSDVLASWGQPGSWFYFNSKTNTINQDLYFSLLTGFEHIRGVSLHEMGHSELSNEYSPRMKELFKKLEEFIDPATGAVDMAKFSKISDKEKKEFALVSKEWELRHTLYHMVEDNCVNQFAANMSKIYPQDFGDSMNHVSIILQGYGELARGDYDTPKISSDKPEVLTKKQKKEVNIKKDKMKELIDFLKNPLSEDEIKKIQKGDISPKIAQRIFDEIKSMVLLSFYEANGLFKSKDETWKRFRIFPEDIKSLVDVSAHSKLDSFSYLHQLAAGKNGINTMQPQPKDRLFGQEHYQEVVARTTAERIKVMDHIWDLYLDKYAKILLKDFKNQVENELEEKDKPKQSQGEGEEGQEGQGQEGQEGQGQEGQGQEGQGQEGQGQEGQGQEGQGQEGQGQEGQGQEGQGQEGQGQPGGSGEGSLSESLKNSINNMKETPEDKRKSDNGDNSANKNADNKEDKKGWGQDSKADEPAEKIDDLTKKDIIEDLSDEQKQAMKEALDKSDKPGDDSLSMDKASRGLGLNLSELAKGDWSNFNRRIIELSPIINHVASGLKKIRNAQKKQTLRRSKNRSYMAEDGDFMGRMDTDKVLDSKYRQAMGIPLEVDDYRRFKEDRVHTDASTIEFYQMIDGSGSMPYVRLNNNTSAMEAALQSAVIMYMACRKSDIDSYIMMWGDVDPVIIARPDSDLKEVGRALESLRNGTGSGTDLEPGLSKSIAEMAKHVNKHGTISGSSHIQIYSDGDIFDPEESKRALKIIMKNSRNLTIDVAVLRSRSISNICSMERVVEDVKKSTHSKMLNLIKGDDANKIPWVLTKNLLKRVRAMEIKTEPDSAKRKRLKTLHRKMK